MVFRSFLAKYLPHASRPSQADASDGGQAWNLSWLSAVSVAAVAVSIQLVHYFSGRSLWADEAKLALNILHQPYANLLHGNLDYGQLAPPGFLVGQKLAVDVLGPSELVLRLLPVLAAIGSIALLLRLLRRLDASPVVRITSLSLFAASPYIALFGSSVKPYTVDVFASILVLLFSVRLWQEDDNRSAVYLGLVGGALLWFSFPVAFVLVGSLSALGVAMLARRIEAGRIAIAVVLLLTVGLPAIMLYVSHDPATREYMRAYWQAGFLPMPPTGWGDIRLSVGALTRLFSHPMGLSWAPLVGVSAFVVGLVGIARTDRYFLALLIAPIVSLVLASGLELYPIGGEPSRVSGRLVLFTYPILTFGMAYGVDVLWNRRHRAIRVLGIGLAVGVIAQMVVQLPAYLTLYRLDTRSALNFIAANQHHAQVIYASGLAWSAAQYYAERKGLDDVVPLTSSVQAECSPGSQTWLIHYDGQRAGTPEQLRLLGEPIAEFEAEGVRFFLVSRPVNKDSSDICKPTAGTAQQPP